VISGALFCALDRESGGKLQARDKGIVNRGSRGGVVFADCAVAKVRHEEFIAQHRESDGKVQPGDKGSVIAVPVVASYSPTVPFAMSTTKSLLPNTASPKRKPSPVMKLGLIAASGGSVVFANKAACSSPRRGCCPTPRVRESPAL